MVRKRTINTKTLWSNIEYLCRVNDTNLSDLARRYYELNGKKDGALNIFYSSKNIGATPSLDRVVDIATIFNVTIEDLLFTDYAKIDEDISELENMLAELKAKKGALSRG